MKIILFLFFLFFFFFPQKTFAANLLDVVISEIGWSGTVAYTSDEWIELYNNTDSPIDFSGWTLKAIDGTPNIALSGTVGAKSYFLLERTGSDTTSVTEDQIYKGVLSDPGESLELKSSDGVLVDSANKDSGGWPAGTGGTGTPIRASMERINLLTEDSDSNWITNDGITKNGLDANGNSINGTPRSQNSQGYVPTPTPTPTSTSTPSPSPTKTPTPKPSTPKPTPTPIATSVSISLNGEEKATSSVLSETSPSSKLEVKKSTPSPKPKTIVASENNLQKILIAVGILFIISSGFWFIRSLKKNE